MDNQSLWHMITAGLVIAELITGTFYLLMLSLGATAAALTALAGGSTTWQILAAAVVGGGAAVLLHLKKLLTNDERDTHIHLDIGTTVHVDAWDEQGLSHVKHRGAVWTASCQTKALNQPLESGLHKIVAIEGSRLVLEKL